MGRGRVYFFKLSAWQKNLLEYYKKNKDFILPYQEENEVKICTKGLKDLSISRTSFSLGYTSA